MAHFAKLNNENIVEQVIVIANDAMLDDNGVEVEKLGLDICRHLYNWDNWKQTSYNATFRGKFADVGDYYDELRGAFIAPKPFDSWILNEETYLWKAPIEMPSDGNDYTWNEESLEWELIDL